MGKQKWPIGNILAVFFLLYCFFLGLDLMGVGFKLFGGGLARHLLETTSNPFAGLFIGVLATSLVQSSSTTTSITVGLVAAEALTIEGAIPIIMGTNIGTSVTNTLVSLAHVTRNEEFRRAFAGATLHDFFNWFTVLLLLPLEIFSNYLSHTAGFLESILEGLGGFRLFDPLKAVVRPMARYLSGFVGELPWLTLMLGILLLFLSLKYLVTMLKTLLSSRVEHIIHRTLFRSAWTAIAAGTALTIMVQSSSITTSSIIPLVGAGVISLKQLFPFTVGANIGTTVTAILAALSTGNPAAVTVAFAHLMFNLSGMTLIYGIPLLRKVPLILAQKAGVLGSKNRLLAVLYIVVVFFGLPLMLLFATGTFKEKASGKKTVQESRSAFFTASRHSYLESGQLPFILKEN